MILLIVTILVVVEIIAIYFMCKGIFHLLKKSIHFSKITFALFIALVLNTSHPLLESGLLSYAIWAAIALGAIYLLCLLPRINCAFKFFCSATVSYMVALMVSSVGLSIIGTFIDKPYEPNLIVELFVKAFCVVISYKALVQEINATNRSVFSNPILVNLERLVASLIYSLAIFIVVVSGIDVLPNFVQFILLFGGVAGSFLVDVILTKD